jgi:hypothetical membrane protein
MNYSKLAACGLIAPFLFLGAIVGFAALRPDYSHLTSAVSELGVQGAPHATAWNAVGFVAVGSLIVALAWGLFQAQSMWLGSALLGLSGLGFVGAGLFAADMADHSSLATRAHIISSLVSFAAFVLGAFVLGWQLVRRSGWRVVGGLSLALGLMAILTMPLREMSVPPGVAQRVSFFLYLAWVELIAIRLWVETNRRPMSPPPSLGS